MMAVKIFLLYSPCLFRGIADYLVLSFTFKKHASPKEHPKNITFGKYFYLREGDSRDDCPPCTPSLRA